MSSNNEIIPLGDAIGNLINSTNDDSATKDFEAARANIQALVETAKDAINDFAGIAQQSQNPAHYATLAKLIDTGINASKSLLDLQSKIRSINGATNPVNGKKSTTVNNVLFAGSTADLQKFIKDMKSNGKNKPELEQRSDE